MKTPKFVFFLPGLVCDGFVWEKQMEGLSDLAGCTCVEWDREDSITAMALRVLAVAPERFAVCGHSMGGRVALEVFRAAPERVSGVALLNTGYQPYSPGPAGQEEAKGRYALLEIAKAQGMRAMAAQWIPPMIHPARRQDTAFVSSIVEMFARKTPEIFELQTRALLSRPDASPVLEQIRCPALVLTGQDDLWSPPPRHTEMAAKIRSSRLVLVPGCAHMSTLERPEAVTEALRSWLSA